MPGGPSSYNSFVKDHPMTTNSIYGYCIQKQLEEKRARDALENHEKREELQKSADLALKSPRLYSNIGSRDKPDFSHARKSNYYIAEPLPDSITKGRFKRRSQIVPKRVDDIVSSDRDVYLWNAVSGCTVRPTL